MDNVNLPSKNAPSIKRTINGQEFTVLIHFQDGCCESAQEKVKGMLSSDVQNAEISV